MNKNYESSSQEEDGINQEILMHRDAHFSGNFDEMIRYYLNDGKGVSANFDVEQVMALAEEERRLGTNLAPEVLAISEIKEIKKAHDAYRSLRDLFNIKNPKTPYPQLIAHLILAESEDPIEEIDAIVNCGRAAVPFLIDLLKSEDFYNPLYPGYGQAPYLAAKCLGKIGDKRAVISLFESIGRGDFFQDETALLALKSIGEPAQEFLLKVLKGRPINEDNERAAIALLSFKDSPQVAEIAFELLEKLDLAKEISLATYLILMCEALKGSSLEENFKKFSLQSFIPNELKKDFNTIFKLWNI